MTDDASSRALLAKTAKGTSWIVGWRMATRVLGVASTLCLVRLLSPADFGLVALASGFAQAIDGLAEIGVEDALVREKARDRDAYDTAFTLNLIRFSITSLAIALAASPIAEFFAEPRLADVLLALAVSTLLGGFSNIGVVDFRRDFAFHKEFKLLVVPRLISIVVAVGSAWIWHSYWALVAGIICSRVLRLCASYAMHPFRPRISLRAWRALVGYSSWVWVISLGLLLRDRIDGFVIGRVLAPGAVGVYAIGAEIAALPTTELVEPLNRAAFSGFSEARRTAASASATYLRVVGTAALLTLPAGIGICLVADPLVRAAFGPAWLAAIPVVRILGCASIVAVFGNIAMVMLSTHGQLRPIFHAVVLGLAARLALLLALIGPFGLPGAAMAAALATVLEQAWFTGTALRHFQMRLADLFDQVWRPAWATACMALAVLACHPGAGLGPADPGTLGALLWPALVGGVAYATALGAAWWARGRPAGAERDLLGLLGRTAAPLLGRLRHGLGTPMRRS